MRALKQRASPLCEHCEAKGRVVPMAIVDHVIPVHVRPDLRLSLGNLQSLCRACHKVKTDDDVKRYGAAR